MGCGRLGNQFPLLPVTTLQWAHPSGAVRQQESMKVREAEVCVTEVSPAPGTPPPAHVPLPHAPHSWVLLIPSATGRMAAATDPGRHIL